MIYLLHIFSYYLLSVLYVYYYLPFISVSLSSICHSSISLCIHIVCHLNAIHRPPVKLGMHMCWWFSLDCREELHHCFVLTVGFGAHLHRAGKRSSFPSMLGKFSKTLSFINSNVTSNKRGYYKSPRICKSQINLLFSIVIHTENRLMERSAPLPGFISKNLWTFMASESWSLFYFVSIIFYYYIFFFKIYKVGML